MKHIEIEALINKFEGHLASDEEREIAAHIATCTECSAESAKIADFFMFAERHTTDEVPQAVTARILNLYQRKPALNLPKTSIGGNIASLIFDDWQIAVNERYSGLDTRQILYRVGDLEIDLRLELIGDNCRLTGQVFPERPDAEIEIASTNQKSTAAISEFGEFAFDLVPQGVYDVRISVDNEILVIEKTPLHR